MAKAAVKKPAATAATKGGRAVATTTTKALKTADVDVTLLMKQDSGKGVSTAAEDNIIPLIYKLHTSSPQVLKQKPEHYIKGAVAGNIWPRGTKTLIDGEDVGLPYIPVAFKKWWMEWGPERGDGLFGRHAYDPTDEDKGRPASEWVEDPKKPGQGSWVMENGHILVETREHAGLAFIEGNWQPAVVSMTSTDHTASRMWMGLMKNKKIPGSDDRAPSFAYVYCLKTIPKTNDAGDWHGWRVEDGMGDGEVTFLPDIDGGVELYKTARQLNADFESGNKRAEDPVAPDGASGTKDDDSDL